MRRLAQSLQTETGDDAIFAEQGNHVRNRADRNNFQEGLKQPLGQPLAQQRLRQLEGYAHARQRLLRIAAVRPARVQDGAGGGQVAVGQVMVGHDAVHAQFARPRQHGVLANAGVHADDHAEALGRGLLNHRHAHAVAIGKPVRDVSLHLRAQHAQRREQHHHRHGAVHIVVTVNQNFFVLLQSAAQTRDGLAHAGHELRRVEVPEAGVKKRLRRRRFRKPPLHQQARHQRRYFHFARQAPGRFCVNR